MSRTPLVLVLALLLAACGAGSDREEAIANLTSGPDALSQEEAECIVDGVGEDRLADFDNFSEEFQTTADPQTNEDLAVVFEAIVDCVMGDIESQLEDLDSQGRPNLDDLDLDDLDLDDLDLDDLDLDLPDTSETPENPDTPGS